MNKRVKLLVNGAVIIDEEFRVDSLGGQFQAHDWHGNNGAGNCTTEMEAIGSLIGLLLEQPEVT